MIVDGEETTDYGGFITVEKSRKEFKCEYESCQEPIKLGEGYCGLVTAHSKKHVYTRKFHRDCFLPFMFGPKS